MQIGNRFAEYGLTGGFFWIGQLCLIATSRTGAELWSKLSATALTIPTGTSQIVATVATGFAGALAIIAVFVAGLLLDMLAAYFLQFEMRVFKKHLDRNDAWMPSLVAQHSAYCQGDYEAFRSKYGETSYWKEITAHFFPFQPWKPEWRQRYRKKIVVGWGRWRLVRPYDRLWSFLTSYVAVLSGSSQLDVMTDQYHLWRTGRAISVALVILFFEAQLTGILFTVADKFDSFALGLALVSLLPLALTGLAIAITLVTYSRLCYTLFSLVYVTREKVPPKAQRGPQEDSESRGQA